MKNVIIIGPAHPLRGGLATFDHRLATQFIREGFKCSIYSFSLQYPSFLFPGKTQYSSDPPPSDIPIYSKINSINPFNWLQIGNSIKKIKPDLVLVRFWLPLIAPALGTILRRIRKNRHTKIIGLIDNIIPHEKRPGDAAFTKYFVNACDAFVTLSKEVMKDLRVFENNKPAIQIPHPLYDNFGETVSKVEAKRKLGVEADCKVLLFFGFIRYYKGLDLLLEAMKILKDHPDPSTENIVLLIAGEFYEDEKKYQQQIESLGIYDMLMLKTSFIPDSEVKYYFSAADLVVQPYRTATQSGVTPLAYHFEKPMVVTRVGGLPAMVENGKEGLVCEPDPESIAAVILQFYKTGEENFIQNIRKSKEKYSWHNMLNEIIDLTGAINKS